MSHTITAAQAPHRQIATFPRPPSRSGDPADDPRTRLDLAQLRARVADRKRLLLEAETAMVAACEQAAARGADPAVHLDDRTTWDRAMWRRYLDAATALEPDYGPTLRRVYREIDQLDRLIALPLVA